MNEELRLAEHFEQHRARLRGVAYRMLGSLSDAEDAVQEAWLRLSRSDASAIENLGGWLTTVVARVCLNALRSRREEPLGVHLPEPIIQREGGADPEREALLSESVGLALLLVLDTLTPAERLAFVLHDMFDIPFEDVARILDRSPAAARQLASRARRRVRGATPPTDADAERRRQVVDAFFAAAHAGDFRALLDVLDADVVLRHDPVPGRHDVAAILRGAEAVARQAASFAHLVPYARPVLVNGEPGALTAPGGRPFALMSFTVVQGRIAEIYVYSDPARLNRLSDFLE